jgi:outer membrane receptor protein involved in Fe transport
MQLERVPLELRHFASNGITIGARATAVHQTGSFETLPLTPFDPVTSAPGEERFWTVDTFVSYRLPKRRGSVSLNADNLLDEAFSFQDIDPSNPSLFPERLISLRFTLSFD